MSEQLGQATADPFAENPSFFFTGAQRQHQLDTLGHLVAFGDMVLLVTGDSGAGKSRLLAELARNAAHRLSVQRLKADSLASASALPGMLSRLSGQALVGMAPADAAREFFRWTASQAGRDRRWVLLVDDAEVMGDEVLSALVDGFSGSDTGQAAVLVLAGTGSLKERGPLVDPARSAMLHEAALPPLGEEDVRHFIHASYDHVGGDATPLLTDAAVRRIQHQSGGNLQVIRRIAPGILAGVTGDARAQRSPRNGRSLAAGFGRVPWRLWAGVALLALGISLVAVSFQYGDDADPAPSDVETAPEAEFDEVERAREVIAETEGTVSQDNAGEGRIRRENEPALDVSPVLIPVGETAAVRESGVTGEQVVPDQSREESRSTSEPGTTDGDTREETENGTEEDEASVADDTAAGSGFQPREPDRFREADWYREEAEGAFTLQLLGSFNESTALEFMERYEVGDAVYTRTRHQGEPWFIVVHGTYPDRDAARAAVESLPERVRALSPWP
ncbi:MAG: AAA family ATPase, partial [Pseudomonadota bacterium]